MELNQLRTEIDQIDKTLADLFAQRLSVAAKIADYKQVHNKPVYDGLREREHLNQVAEQTPTEYEAYTRVLFSTIMNLSRSYQTRRLGICSASAAALQTAIDATPALFPEKATVACQGTEGAYSQQACDKLFRTPNILYVSSFEGVFRAVEQGLCRYGILPLENSTAGSVNQIYDLMRKHRFTIVRSVRLQIVHSLLAKPNVALSELNEIFSHEQAISQCSEFLQALQQERKAAGKPELKLTICENTAIAAKLVSESERTDCAALSSQCCAELYGLSALSRAVQNESGNYTRFICISKALEVYPGADRTSIMMVVPHKPGALYQIISRFYELGINLVKLESRPIPSREFEFMFYFDIAASIYSDDLRQLLCELESQVEELEYLGSYSEVVG